MHSSLGGGYRRFSGTGSARKLVFIMGVTALSGVLLLGVASTLIELPEDSEKWSKLLSASSIFCIGLSFLMWCVDELVITPLALGEWTVRSWIPFRWTREHESLLRAARAYRRRERGSERVTFVESDFPMFSGCLIESMSGSTTTQTEGIGNANTRNQTPQNNRASQREKTLISIAAGEEASSEKKKDEVQDTRGSMYLQFGVNAENNNQVNASLRDIVGETEKGLVNLNEQISFGREGHNENEDIHARRSPIKFFRVLQGPIVIAPAEEDLFEGTDPFVRCL